MRNKRILSICVATLLCAASLPARGTDSPGADKVARPASAAVVVAKQQAVSADLPGKQDGELVSATVSLSSVQLNASVNAQSGISGDFVDSGGQRWASAGTCQDCDAGFCDGQTGVQGNFAQECNEDNCWDLNGNGVCDPATEDVIGDGTCDSTDCSWPGFAFPIMAPGGSLDTLRFQLNTNRVGGDVYIVGESDLSPCQPDVNNILARMCCALEGLETGVSVDLHFPEISPDAGTLLWVLFVARTGKAGQDDEGSFDGSVFPSHHIGRECAPDAEGECTVPSQPGLAYVNLVGPGLPGFWRDLHDLGLFGLGTCYCVELTSTSQDPDNFDCAAVLTGACCVNPIGQDCVQTRGFECPGLGGVYLGDGTECGVDDCLGCNSACVWDIDGSGDVRVPDLIKLLSCWGPLTGDPDCACLDIDGSGDIRVPDLIALLAKWGVCP